MRLRARADRAGHRRCPGMALRGKSTFRGSAPGGFVANAGDIGRGRCRMRAFSQLASAVLIESTEAHPSRRSIETANPTASSRTTGAPMTACEQPRSRERRPFKAFPRAAPHPERRSQSFPEFSATASSERRQRTNEPETPQTLALQRETPAMKPALVVNRFPWVGLAGEGRWLPGLISQSVTVTDNTGAEFRKRLDRWYSARLSKNQVLVA